MLKSRLNSTEKRHGFLMPGCGTAIYQATMLFKLKYDWLLDPEGKDIKKK